MAKGEVELQYILCQRPQEILWGALEQDWLLRLVHLKEIELDSYTHLTEQALHVLVSRRHCNLGGGSCLLWRASPGEAYLQAIIASTLTAGGCNPWC